jgi:DNA-binding CsgD family transcriptional regulator
MPDRAFPASAGGIASAMNDQRGPAPPTRPGAGVDDPAELMRLISMIRAAEATDPARQRDMEIGEFTVSGARIPADMIAPLQTLSRTEAAVMRFLGWGRSNADIGTLLNMTENTVRTHLNNAIHKLEVDGARGLNSLAGLLFHPL